MASWVPEDKTSDKNTWKEVIAHRRNVYIESAGHGVSSGRFQRYKEVALEYAFMFDLVGVRK